MLNGRTIYLGVLWILFIAAVFGQQPPDSQVITVPGKIDLGKLNTTVGTLDTTVGKLDTTVGELSKTVGELKTTVTRLDERTKWISNLQFVILAAILGGPVVTIFFYRRFGKNNEDVNMVDRLTEQITKLISAQAENSEQIVKLTSAQVEISAQITSLISAQAENSATGDVPGDPEVPRMDRLDKLTDDIPPTYHDVRETA